MSTNPTLPDGWTYEDIGSERILIENPQRGMVTVDFDRRLFRSGYSTRGPGQTTTKYTGRGWRERLLADAIVWLQAVYAW